MGEFYYYPTLQIRKQSLREVRSLAQDHTAWKMQKSSNPWQSELHSGLSTIFKPIVWDKKVFSVNEENPPTQKCTCVSLEWPRKEARDTETDSLSPREMPCGWRLREASKSCSAVNLASQCSSDRRKTVTPKALLPAQVPRGTEQTRERWHFWEALRREKTRAGFQVLCHPCPTVSLWLSPATQAVAGVKAEGVLLPKNPCLHVFSAVSPSLSVTLKAGSKWLRLQGKVRLLGALWAELLGWNDLVCTRRGWCWDHGRQVKSPVHPGAGGECWSVTVFMVRVSHLQLHLSEDNGSTFYLDAVFPRRPGLCVCIYPIHSQLSCRACYRPGSEIHSAQGI